MRTRTFPLLCALVLLGSAACAEKTPDPQNPTPTTGNTGTPEGTGSQSSTLPGPSGAEVVEYFMKTAPYQTWNLLPVSKYPNTIRTEYLRKGSHRFFNGKIAKTYYNDIGKRALDQGAKEMPPSTMIVVPRWNQAADGSIGPEEKPDDIVVMYKIKDYNPENGDWFYLTYKQDKIAVEGKVEGCQSCHSKAADNDYRFTDSGKMAALAPSEPPALEDNGEEFVKAVTTGFHYTHYDLLPDDQMGKVIPRNNEFTGGIDWFNGNLAARIFVNSTALSSLTSGAKEHAPGSIYLAEQYKRGEDGKPMPSPFAIVAQVKVEGFDPRHGDWAYLAYSFEEQKILAFGGSKTARFCTDCHDKVRKNDYIWSTSGKRPKK